MSLSERTRELVVTAGLVLVFVSLVWTIFALLNVKGQDPYPILHPITLTEK